MLELPVHESVVYPVDLIKKSNIYIHENEMGYVYPVSFLDFDSLDDLWDKCGKDSRVNYLAQLCYTLEDLHKEGIFLNGFDKKQVLIQSKKIKFRYNGFKNHNRNSIYKVPDYFAEKYTSMSWILDAFSLVAVIFECMYEWNPFCGMMTSFSSDEEYQFEIYYNNFRKKIFIFEEDKKLNQIGFLMEQKSIIKKWLETDRKVCDFFNHILTMDIPKYYTQEFVFDKIHELINYYNKTEMFK